jgi:hypothetical protein
LATDTEVRVRFSALFSEVVGLERGPLSLVSTPEELLERKRSGSGLEKRDYGRRESVSGHFQDQRGLIIVLFNDAFSSPWDRLCGLVVRVLGYRSGGPGSIPGTTRKKN